MTSRSEVKPGQVWSWAQPNGERREMLVQSIQNGPGWAKRAVGVHPQSGRRMQVLLSTLERGLLESRLERVIEGYEYVKTPATRSGRW